MKTSKHPTKKEKYYDSIRTQFNNGSLSESQLRRLPSDRQQEYLRTQLFLKLNKVVTCSCLDCAINVLFDNKGEITDEELIIENK